MFRSWNLGRVAGIDVRIHPTFWILPLFIGLGALFSGEGVSGAFMALVFLAMLFTVVVLHELGHALAARRFEVRTLDITLLPIGGQARLERIPEKPFHELVIALAGPMVNVAIVAIMLLVSSPFGGGPLLLRNLAEGGLFGTLFAINLMLIVFNLLPAFPMDGGRVLRSLLAMRVEYLRATEIAVMVGRVTASLFIIWALFGGVLMSAVTGQAASTGPMPFLAIIGVFVWIAGGAELRMLRWRRANQAAYWDNGIPVYDATVLEDNAQRDRDWNNQRRVVFTVRAPGPGVPRNPW